MRVSKILTSCWLLALPLLAQRTDFYEAPPCSPVVAAPLSETSVSVVTRSTDPALILGTYALRTEGPAVVDGDTIRVTGLKASLRLVGIDTEETFKDAAHFQEAQQDWKAYVAKMYAGHPANRPPKFSSEMGEAAKHFARAFFKDVKDVHLEYDDKNETLGYFGRHLTHVLAEKDGVIVDFNIEVVRQGLSPYFIKYGRSVRFHDRFTKAQEEAKTAGRGIWAKPPLYASYPDYPARLAWWTERANAQDLLKIRRQSEPTLYLLGQEPEWERLKKAEGQVVTVAGVPGTAKVIREDLTLFPLGHKNRRDFLIAGPQAAIDKLGITGEEGNMILVTGKVSLHRGEPQFAVADVTGWSRAPTK